MPIKTIRGQERNLTTHFVTGAVSEEEMHATLEAFYDKEPTAQVLWDMSRADLAHVQNQMLSRFLQKAATLGTSRQGCRTAVVAPDDYQYGLGRMSEAFAEIENTPFRFRVFRSQQNALKWLGFDDNS